MACRNHSFNLGLSAAITAIQKVKNIPCYSLNIRKQKSINKSSNFVAKEAKLQTFRNSPLEQVNIFKSLQTRLSATWQNTQKLQFNFQTFLPHLNRIYSASPWVEHHICTFSLPHTCPVQQLQSGFPNIGHIAAIIAKRNRFHFLQWPPVVYKKLGEVIIKWN